MAELSRRELIQAAVAAGVCLAAPTLANAAADAAAPAGGAQQDACDCTWLDTRPDGGAAVGATWGVPWGRGKLKAGTPLHVVGDDGQAVPTQSWTTASWPDGSVKWAAVAVGPGTFGKTMRVAPGEGAKTAGHTIQVTNSTNAIMVDTGVIRCAVAAGFSRGVVIHSIERGGKTVLKDGRLVALRQDTPEVGDGAKRETFLGQIGSSVALEQSGPVRAVVKLTGTHLLHAADKVDAEDENRHPPTGRQWLPFVLRLYFYAGSDVVRMVHSFVFDGDEGKDFICGLGLRFSVPLLDELHNRHVRFVGTGHGLLGEAVRTITGLRRDPGRDARQAQVDGKATSADTWAPSVANPIGRVPAFGDYTLTQLSADGFQVRKRTKAGCGWVPVAAGTRAAGVGYVGGAGGGVSFGVRDFWQKHPAQLDVRNAATDVAEVTCWLYSPEARPMDLRMYHDVMGMETYDQQNEGLGITYEDYEPGYGTPYGVARTSELSLRAEAATPARENLVQFADAVRTPPLPMASPGWVLNSGVLGAQWTLPDQANPTKAWIEETLGQTLDAYLREIDQRSWYGFWDFGDVMHSYDSDRHVWKYDVGGFAWDNSELSTDLWLWLSVLRTGRADVFRMAEAMARHTGEVDVYHLGRFKGLGTRHGVQHWADSSKQSRISTPLYRRIYYYLTADERTGDLLDEQMHTIRTEKKIVITRKIKPGSPTLPLPAVEDAPPGGDVDLGGLNWGNAMAAWITHAERTGDAAWHAKIVEAMKGVGDLPNGFYRTGWTMDIDTGKVTDHGKTEIGLSHLMACFGLPEIANELVSLYGEQAPKFAAAWAQYGRLYGGTDEQRRKELGDFRQGLFKEASLRDTHSRCTAFAAVHDNDPQLAKRAWAELLGNRFTPDAPHAQQTKIEGPAVLSPVIETQQLSTNGSAQWGLAAMQCLALIGDQIS